MDEATDGIPLDVPRLLRGLRRRWWVVGLAGALAAGAALYWARGVVYLYEGSALVQLSPSSREVLTDRIAGTDGPTYDPVFAQLGLSQLEVVRSSAVVGAVVDSEPLGLRVKASGFPSFLLTDVALDPATPATRIPVRFGPTGVMVGQSAVPVPYGLPVTVGGLRFVIARAPRASERASRTDPAIVVLSREKAMERVAGGIQGRAREKSMLIDITYTSLDPSLALRVANRTAFAFQEDAARKAQQQSHRRRVFIEEQLARVDSQLNAAQMALNAFRARQQAFSSADKFSGQQRDLLDLQLRERDLLSRLALERGILGQFQQGTADGRAQATRMLASAPGLGDNTIIARLVDHLVGYETSKTELLNGPDALTARNPDVLKYDSLIVATQSSLTNTLRSHIALLDAQLRDVQTQRAIRERDLAALPSATTEEAKLSQNTSALLEQGNLLRTELQKARIAEAAEIGPVEILNLESHPRALGRGLSRVVILATLLGLGAGVVLVAVPVIRDRSLKRRRDVEGAVRVPVLATIPRIELAKSPRRRLPSPRWTKAARQGTAMVRSRGVALATLDVHAYPGAEAYRHLRATLFSTRFGEAPRKLLVTSALPAEGKTSVAANLATTLSRQGHQVLLVDSDLRNGKLHRIFNMKIGPGMTDALLGDEPPLELLQRDPASGVFVMTAGTRTAEGSDLLAGPRLRAMLNDFAHQFDAVIIDSAPVLAVSDSAVLGASVDAVLLVVRAGETTATEATAAARQLVHSGAPLAGVVLNDPDGELLDEPTSTYYYAYAAAGG